MKDFIIMCAKIALGVFIAGALILGTIKGSANNSLLHKTKNVMQQNLDFQKNYP
ncbi:hypothetical protein [Vallitalea guaymasensis]|uniref:Uncharacterized protein n=1 Tax=Vallitalea guaymasensis TaxID=1185412 RepID=A0A8J8MA37_9FIRM|nr:hypothetical protein [Vallitalea guaymasensis]QUH29176.1 hypothetical protein HYG85_09660 [Vallitalea guaymasensis]